MIKCVIFDLDGVIVSTDEFHYQAWQLLASHYKIPFSREINEKLRGISRAESLEIMLRAGQMAFSDQQKSEMMELKNRYYLESLKHLSAADLLPGVLPTLKMLSDMNLPVAIGSSSKNAKHILNQIGFSESFDYVADGTQIKNSKPHPEVFLLAAEKLAVEPVYCLVVEDAESGVEAAKNANMSVLAVGAATKCANADYKAANLSEFDWTTVFPES